MRTAILLALVLGLCLPLSCSNKEPSVVKQNPDPDPDPDPDELLDDEEVTYSLEIQPERTQLSTTPGDTIAIKVIVRELRDQANDRVTEDSQIQVSFALTTSSTSSAELTVANPYVDDLGEVQAMLRSTDASVVGELTLRIAVEKDGDLLPGIEEDAFQKIKVTNQIIGQGEIPAKIVLTTAQNKISIFDGESVDLTAQVLDKNDLPVKSITVTLELTEGTLEQGELYLNADQHGQTVEGKTDRLGNFTAKLRSNRSKETVFTVTGSFIYNLIPYRATIKIYVEKRPFGGIEFMKAEPVVIGTQGSGNPVSSTVSFRVFDPENQPLAGYNVSFRIIKPDLDASLNTHITTTNEAGEAYAHLTSGHMPGPVLIEATATFEVSEADGSKSARYAQAATTRIVIASNLPSNNRFYMASDRHNVPSLEVIGETAVVSVLLGDRNGNPVPEGTAVAFFVENGVIESPGVTDKASAAAGTWHSGGEPRNVLPGNGNPVDGFLTVLAVTVGNEFFFDYNANGVYDPGIDTFDTKNVDQETYFDLVSRPDDFRQAAKSDDDPTKSRFYKCSSDAITPATINPTGQDNPADNLKGIPDGDYDPPICYKEASLGDFHFHDQGEPFLDEDSDLTYYRIFGDVISNGDFYITDDFYEEEAFSPHGLGLDGRPAVLYDENDNLKTGFLSYLNSRRIYVPSVPFIDYGEWFIDESLDNNLLDPKLFPPEFDFINFLNYRLEEFNPPDGVPTQLKMIWKSIELVQSGLPIVAYINPIPNTVDCNGTMLDPSYCRTNPQVRGNPFSGTIGRPSFEESFQYFFTSEYLRIPDGDTRRFRVYIGDVNGNPLSEGSTYRAFVDTDPPPAVRITTADGQGGTREDVINFAAADMYTLSPSSEEISILDWHPEGVLSHAENGAVIFDFYLTNTTQSVPIPSLPFTLEIEVHSTHPYAADKISLAVTGTFLGTQ